MMMITEAKVWVKCIFFKCSQSNAPKCKHVYLSRILTHPVFLSINVASLLADRCRCQHSWTSPFKLCPGNYNGCAIVPCRRKQDAWCMVENKPCANEYKNAGWAYCTPIECDGSRIPYAVEYKQERLSASTAFLEPNQPENSKLIFPCSAGYEEGTIVFVCDRSGEFKAVNQCVKLSTTTSTVPVTCDGTDVGNGGPEVGHSTIRYDTSTAYLAPFQPLMSTLIMGCSANPRDGSVTFICEADGVFRARENCTGWSERGQPDFLNEICCTYWHFCGVLHEKIFADDGNFTHIRSHTHTRKRAHSALPLPLIILIMPCLFSCWSSAKWP